MSHARHIVHIYMPRPRSLSVRWFGGISRQVHVACSWRDFGCLTRGTRSRIADHVEAGSVHVRIIDAHHHVWDLSNRDQEWTKGDRLAPLRRSFTLSELEPQARAAGVVATVLVQTVTSADETPELLSLASGNQLIAGVVGWTDLTAPDVMDRLAALRELPGGDRLVGIRHQVQAESDPQWLLRSSVRASMAALTSHGLVHELVIRPHQIPAAIGAAKASPELTFVIDHLGKPPIRAGELHPWADHMRQLAALPNTVCKLSGMVTLAVPGSWTCADIRPYVDVVLGAFGPHRTMFGSDWPICLLETTYAGVVDIAGVLMGPLSVSDREDVFARTAERTYQLHLRT